MVQVLQTAPFSDCDGGGDGGEAEIYASPAAVTSGSGDGADEDDHGVDGDSDDDDWLSFTQCLLRARHLAEQTLHVLPVIASCSDTRRGISYLPCKRKRLRRSR